MNADSQLQFAAAYEVSYMCVCVCVHACVQFNLFVAMTWCGGGAVT